MSPGERTPESIAITALLALVRQRWGPGYALRTVRYEVQGPDGLPQKVMLDPTLVVLGQAARSAAEAERASDRSSARRRIIEVLRVAEAPIPKGSIVALRAGLEYGPHFRTVFKQLQNEGVVLPRERGGYWLAERPLP